MNGCFPSRRNQQHHHQSPFWNSHTLPNLQRNYVATRNLKYYAGLLTGWSAQGHPEAASSFALKSETPRGYSPEAIL